MLPVLAFDLPLAGVFFPSVLHRYFKPPASKPRFKWLPTESFRHAVFKGTAFFFVTGDLAFLRDILPSLPDLGRVIMGVEMPLRSTHSDSAKFLARSRAKAARFLINTAHLSAVTLRDSRFGGATDASFVFGFGNQLHGSSIPVEVPHAPYVLRHYLDGGARGWYDRCSSLDLPTLEDEVNHVIWGDPQLASQRRVRNGPNPGGDDEHFVADHAGAFIRQEGLFPRNNPLVRVACPSYFVKRKLSLRPLTMPEVLRLHQLPLDMDSWFRDGFKISDVLPFEDCASPVIYTSILRQLWGVDGGGLFKH